jgi:putative membrane protein
MPEGPVDYRFLLANERTFLAYVRTALALQIAGLGVLQFLTQGHDAVRLTLGAVLVATGSYVGAAGYLRFRHNERAIRAGLDMPRARAGLLLTVAVAGVPLAAALLLVLR